MKKSETPKRRYYTLRPLMRGVLVQSHSNGWLLVKPCWRRKFENPGVMTRLAASQRLEKLINDHLKGRK